MKYFIALAPVLLHINPILGSLIGLVATLIFVAVAIIVVVRLRGNRDSDNKDCVGGNLTTSTSDRCIGNTEVELLDKGSLDSLEEKNPDIVPNKSTINVYMNSSDGFCTAKTVSFYTNNPYRIAMSLAAFRRMTRLPTRSYNKFHMYSTTCNKQFRCQ